MKRKGFTLIELLVVVSIIALLVSILLPALGKAREQAKRAVCAGNLHSYATCIITYAADHEGEMPNFPQDNGIYIVIVGKPFLDFMKGYGLKDEEITCPCVTSDYADYVCWYNYEQTNPNYQTVKMLGYSLWMTRWTGGYNGRWLPPQFTDSLVYIPNPDIKHWGPKKIGDSLAKSNPIIADMVVGMKTAGAYNNPWNIAEDEYLTNRNASIYWGYEDGSKQISLMNHLQHKWKGKMEMANEAFADGHVEGVNANDLVPRYCHHGSANGESIDYWQWW